MKQSVLLFCAICVCLTASFPQTFEEPLVRSYKIKETNWFPLFERAIAKSNWPPAFCHKLNCPKFSVVEKHEQYEIREYEPANWVTTSGSGYVYWVTASRLFKRLFEYIDGYNAENKKINMTVPVLIQVYPRSGTWQKTYVMSFYVANAKAPKPSDARVKLTRTPKLRAYIRSFEGYMVSLWQYKRQLKKLKNSIGKNTTYKAAPWVIAGYDPPTKIAKRHNEVGLLLK